MKQSLVIIEAPGKIRAWKRAEQTLGLSLRVITTRGHMSRFPDRLDPLGVRFVSGRAIDYARTPCARVSNDLIAAVDVLPRDGMIYIATDDDLEGDVIALDVLRVILAHNRNLGARIRRVRARAVTLMGITHALSDATQPMQEEDIVRRAVPGRARAISDRWIGMTYSKLAGTGCGRVRAAMLGASLFWTGEPGAVQGIPETGELTFQVRAQPMGLPFTARVPLFGKIDKVLLGLARKYQGEYVPGFARPMASIGAAVAPRMGNVAPFNTGDALAYAARHHNITPKVAMRGLQDAYMNGRISYPRTDSRTLSPMAAELIIQAGRACGLRDLGPEYAQRHLPDGVSDVAHDALYPTPDLRHEELLRLKTVVRASSRKTDHDSLADIEDLMVALVARRAFEACRSADQMPGVWHDRPGSDLTLEERERLADLEWLRPAGPGLPWTHDLSTGFREWPISAILIDGMMMEGVGRPSTYATHAQSIASSGQIHTPHPGSLPIPTPEGIKILRKLPKGAWHPGVCRAIEAALQVQSSQEENSGDLLRRVRQRIDAWVSAAPKDLSAPLIAELQRQDELYRTERPFDAGAPVPDPSDPPRQAHPDDDDPVGAPESLVPDLIC